MSESCEFPAIPPASEPLLTIAIPFFCGREYLRKAIDSVLGQTSPRWELLVCDDHGPEAGIDRLIAAYADSRIRYVRNAVNLGLAGNWNRCLDLARTDLVTLLHADDQLRDDYCALMAAAHRYPSAVALFCGATIIDETGTRSFSFADFVKWILTPSATDPFFLHGPGSLAALLRANFIFCPTVCYRKSVLGSRRFSTEWQFVQDLALNARLLLDGETFVGLRIPAYAYRRHSANTTRKYEENLVRFREEVALYDSLAEQAAARGWNRVVRVAESKRIIKLNLLYGLLDHLIHRRWRQAAKRLEFLDRLL